MPSSDILQEILNYKKDMEKSKDVKHLIIIILYI
mgnify:CR=1 FL=1